MHKVTGFLHAEIAIGPEWQFMVAAFCESVSLATGLRSVLTLPSQFCLGPARPRKVNNIGLNLQPVRFSGGPVKPGPALPAADRDPLQAGLIEDDGFCSWQGH